MQCVLDEVMILEMCLQSMNYDTDLIIPLSSLSLLCVHSDKNEQKEMVSTFENDSFNLFALVIFW